MQHIRCSSHTRVCSFFFGQIIFLFSTANWNTWIASSMRPPPKATFVYFPQGLRLLTCSIQRRISRLYMLIVHQSITHALCHGWTSSSLHPLFSTPAAMRQGQFFPIKKTTHQWVCHVGSMHGCAHRYFQTHKTTPTLQGRGFLAKSWSSSP